MLQRKQCNTIQYIFGVVRRVVEGVAYLWGERFSFGYLWLWGEEGGVKA